MIESIGPKKLGAQPIKKGSDGKTIVLNLPEDIAKELSEREGDLSLAALESLALEGYRAGHLSEEQVRRMLSFTSRFDVHAFLKRHNTHLNYTEADLEHDLAVARSL